MCLAHAHQQDLAILLVMAAGALSVWRALVFQREDMRVFNVFLFKAALPASVILGLGVCCCRPALLWLLPV
jgi:hypothetical protein